MNKIKELINNLKLKFGPKIIAIDTKFGTFMPNPKIRKIVYITMGSLFGLMLLIIILGLLLSPLRKTEDTSGTILNKPSILNSSPEPAKELSETQKKILNLELRTKEMTFPESILNTPVLESNIKIESSN